MSFSQNEAQTIQALAAVAQVFFSLVVIALSFFTIRLTAATVKENMLLRRAETDPHVAVYCDVPEGQQIIDVVIKNLGRGPAYNVRCVFDTAEMTRLGKTLDEYPFFQHLEFLAPQAEIRAFVDVASSLLEKRTFTPVRVTVSYRSSDMRAITESFQLDPYVFEGIPVRDDHSLDKLIRAIDNNTKAVKAVADRIDKQAKKMTSQRTVSQIWLQLTRRR